MSYILDALRRAEAERERGAVPSLQSQQHTVIEEDEAVPRSRGMMWLAIALAAALVAALAWNFLGRSAPAPRPIVEGSVTAPAPAPALAPTAIAPAAPVAAPASEAIAAASTAPLTAAAPARPAPAAPKALARTAPPAALAAAETRRARRHEGSDAVAPLPASTPTPAAATTRAETRIYAQAELPEEIRRDLPKVAINGSSYSGDPASRMVMVNGQIFHEGDKLGGGLALEKINRRSAVFSFRGYRYEITF